MLSSHGVLDTYCTFMCSLAPVLISSAEDTVKVIIRSTSGLQSSTASSPAAVYEIFTHPSGIEEDVRAGGSHCI